MKVRKFLPGTTVKIWCATYWHFGLVDQTGMRVIHNSKKHGKVVRESLAAFAGDADVHVCQEVFSRNVFAAIQRAENAIGMAYDLWKANCEHFVRWAHGLEPASPQLQRALATAAGLALLANSNPLAKAAGFGSIAGSWLAPKGSSPAVAALSVSALVVAVGLLASAGG